MKCLTNRHPPPPHTHTHTHTNWKTYTRKKRICILPSSILHKSWVSHADSTELTQKALWVPGGIHGLNHTSTDELSWNSTERGKVMINLRKKESHLHAYSCNTCTCDMHSCNVTCSWNTCSCSTGTIQQRSSSSLPCRRPLWTVLARAGMSTVWYYPYSIARRLITSHFKGTALLKTCTVS